jgi:hypothetical protein
MRKWAHTIWHRRRLIRARGARAPQYLGQGAHAIDEPPPPPIIKTNFGQFITYLTGKTLYNIEHYTAMS